MNRIAQAKELIQSAAVNEWIYQGGEDGEGRSGVIERPSDIPTKSARDLATFAQAWGWKWVAGNGVDSGGNPFFTILVGNPADGERYKLTWHTRATGTYRLFSKIHARATGADWRDAPSLEIIRRRIQSRASLAFDHADVGVECGTRESAE